MSAIIHKFNGANRGANEQYQQLLDKITQCLNTELSELMGNMFDGADDMIFQLAENADTNEDQNGYFDTMRMLRIERSNISQSFASHLQSYLQIEEDKVDEDSLFDENELSLVDQNEMEEMVAVSAMHSKAMNLYGEAVNHLEARIEFLSMKSSVFKKDALAPKNMGEAFKSALTDVELNVNSKLLLYKLFDQEVIVKLAPLYKKLNQIFIDQGILPQIKLGEQKSSRSTPTRTTDTEQAHSADTPQSRAGGHQNAARTGGGAHAGGNGGNTTASSPLGHDAVYNENPTCDPIQSASFSNHQFSGNNSIGMTSGATNVQQEVHRVVNQFLQGELTASGPGIPSSFTRTNSAAPGTQYYDRRDVMRALSNLQAGVAQTPADEYVANIAGFKQTLIQDMSQRSGGAVTKQVSQVDEKTIDFIEMLFDAIVEDASISDTVTNLLLRMQIPVIKVAMLDENFFVDGDHPARTCLNLIAYLGRGITDKSDVLYASLEHVVESLLDDFQIDISSFESAVGRLQGIEDYEIKKAAEKERETQKEVLQKHAREIVLAELQFLVLNKVLPKPCQKLLLKHWSTLMFHRYIKFGKNSEDWASAVETARSFIKIVQPIESSQAFHQLTTEKDNVLDEIQNTLLQTRQNPVEIETEINNTFVTIESLLENSKFHPDKFTEEETYYTSVSDDVELDMMPDPEVELIDEEEVVDPLEEQARLSREKIAKLSTDVRPGVWFEVHTGNDSALRRAKLSVMIMEEAKLIFVDRIGVKVVEKDAEEFSQELESGKSAFISDHSAFDHALGLVINSLSSTN